MDFSLDEIIKKLPELEREIQELRDSFLANIVMLSEIPSPTFMEEKRQNFLLNRFTEAQLLNCSSDEVGNALGILPGTVGEKNILLVSHLDTLHSEEVDHSMTVTPENIIGPGVCDNGLGLAAIATLPMILKHLDISLNHNLVLMGSSRSLGKGNIEGLRFFLENSSLDIDYGLVVEGVKLGRLSHSSIGMLRGEITYQIPEEYDWTSFGSGGAIVSMNEIINKILEIPLPSRPRTTFVLGSFQGGRSFNKIANKATLQFEIRSESEEQVHRLRKTIEYITADQASRTGADVSFNILAFRKPGGIDFSHPLTMTARAIIKGVDIVPRVRPSTSELSAFIDSGIPAVTLGISNGENLGELEETIEIKPSFKGLAQLIGIIIAMDRGIINGHK